MTLTQTSGLQHLDNIGSATTFHMPGNFTPGSSAVFASAAFLNGQNAPISSVVIGGTAATRVSIRQPDANNSGEIWLAQNVVGGVDTVVVTPGGGGYFISCACDEWSGFSASAFDVQNTNNGTSTSPTVTSPTLNQAAEVAYSVMFQDNGNNVSMTPPGGWTSMFNEPDGVNEEPGAAAWLIVSSTAAVTSTWTYGTNQTWNILIATFKLGGAPPPTLSSGSSLSELVMMPDVRFLC